MNQNQLRDDTAPRSVQQQACSAATPETDAMEATDAWQWDDEPPAPYRRMVELCRQMEAERNTARRCMEYLEVWEAALEQPNAKGDSR